MIDKNLMNQDYIKGFQNYEDLQRFEIPLLDERILDPLGGRYDPLKHSIATGDDAVLDDVFSYQRFNDLKNNWRASVAPADIQAGMLFSDSDDDILYHYDGADLLQIIQADSTGETTFPGVILIPDYIKHGGDLDTYFYFSTDIIFAFAGGKNMLFLNGIGDYLSLYTGKNFIGATANANMDLGLYILGGGEDKPQLILGDSDVAHGITDPALTSTYAQFEKADLVDGGLGIRTYTEDNNAFFAVGVITNDNTTRSTAGRSIFEFVGTKKSGTSPEGNLSANQNVLGIRARRGGALETVAIFDEDGDLDLDGAVNNNAWDKFDDIQLASDLSRVLSNRFDEIVTYDAQAMHDARLIEYTPKGKNGAKKDEVFIKVRNMLKFNFCTIRQMGIKFNSVEERIEFLEGQVKALTAH